MQEAKSGVSFPVQTRTDPLDPRLFCLSNCRLITTQTNFAKTGILVYIFSRFSSLSFQTSCIGYSSCRSKRQLIPINSLLGTPSRVRRHCCYGKSCDVTLEKNKAVGPQVQAGAKRAVFGEGKLIRQGEGGEQNRPKKNATDSYVKESCSYQTANVLDRDKFWSLERQPSNRGGNGEGERKDKGGIGHSNGGVLFPPRLGKRWKFKRDGFFVSLA